MITKTIEVLIADEGKVLYKDGVYTSVLSLIDGETGEGWVEIDQPEGPEPEVPTPEDEMANLPE